MVAVQSGDSSDDRAAPSHTILPRLREADAAGGRIDANADAGSPSCNAYHSPGGRAPLLPPRRASWAPLLDRAITISVA